MRSPTLPLVALATWLTTSTLLLHGSGCHGADVDATVIPGSAPPECAPPDLPMGKGHGGNAQIQAPAQFDEANVTRWLGRMKAMRTACQKVIGYTGAASLVPELKWTQTAYISPQMHPYDKFFFDPILGNGTGGAGYTVDKWLADLNRRYGGIDKALIWPTYTNIGIDDRNTFDLIRSMPGGAEGIKVVVEQLHARGVKVLWPYHPWDHSTKGQQRNNETDFVAMAELQRDTGGDGFNGDTMAHIPRAFYDAAVKIYKPIALEAEGGLSNAWDLNYVTVGWGEGWIADEAGAKNNAPDVDKPKWLTEGKIMTNWCARWAGNPVSGKKSKISEIQVSWFNGLGYESWENVWGTWNGIIERDGEALRRVGTMLRFFGTRGFLQSAEWVPHSTDVLTMDQGVFASKFPLLDPNTGKPSGDVLYTLVNRMAAPSALEHVKPSGVGVAALKWFDCYRGTPLTLTAAGTLHFNLEPTGFGCVLGTSNATWAYDARADDGTLARELRAESVAPPQPGSLGALLSTMGALTARNLSTFSPDFVYPQFTLVDWNASTVVRPLRDGKAGEVYVPGSDFHFKASGVEIEGGAESGVDVQYPWEPHAIRDHDHTLHVGAMYVDTHPVTNANYSRYLQASGYAPMDRANWLKHNFEGNVPRVGWADRPVTYVSLEDARHYCAFHKKRLPHVHEWQYFAQGIDGRTFPWGDKDDAAKTSAVNNDYVNPGPEAVGRHPDGASPFGVQDLVRSVWQYTTEVHDEHTRSVLLRGGSNYGPWRGGSCRWISNNDGTPKMTPPACFNKTFSTPVPGSVPHPMGGSMWYFPPAFQNDQYNKYFLMSGSYERAGTIGFRCVADAEDDCGTDGHLCTTSEVAPPAVALDGSAATHDWVIFRGGGGTAGAEAKAGVALASTLRYSVLNGNTTAGTGATKFSWTGGMAPGASGSDEAVGIAVQGPKAAFQITAPAPATAAAAMLTVYVGVGAGVSANLSTRVQGVAGNPSNWRLISAGRAVTIKYKGGPLLLTYSALTPGVCADPQYCIHAPTAIKTVVELSPPGVVDWAHWGKDGAHSDRKAPWFAEVMKAGPGLLVPQLLGRDGKPPPAGALHTYSKPAATYHWTHGTPVLRSKEASGVWTAADLFRMDVAPPADLDALWATTWRLSLYVGTCKAPGLLRVARAGKQDLTLVVPSNKHQATSNVAIDVVFTGKVSVTWGKQDPEDEEGNITWQAAVLTRQSPVTVQAAVLR